MTILIIVNIWLIIGAIYIGLIYKELQDDDDYVKTIKNSNIRYRLGVSTGYVVAIILWPIMLVKRVLIHYGNGSE